MTTPTVGIVGGGILGLTAAYRLARQGVRVSVFEASDNLGGLGGTFDRGGYAVDRFYHQLWGVAKDQVQWAQAEAYYQQALANQVEYGDRYKQAGIYQVDLPAAKAAKTSEITLKLGERHFTGTPTQPAFLDPRTRLFSARARLDPAWSFRDITQGRR